VNGAVNGADALTKLWDLLTQSSQPPVRSAN